MNEKSSSFLLSCLERAEVQVLQIFFVPPNFFLSNHSTYPPWWPLLQDWPGIKLLVGHDDHHLGFFFLFPSCVYDFIIIILMIMIIFIIIIVYYYFLIYFLCLFCPLCNRGEGVRAVWVLLCCPSSTHSKPSPLHPLAVLWAL